MQFSLQATSPETSGYTFVSQIFYPLMLRRHATCIYSAIVLTDSVELNWHTIPKYP
jgi:hypothetical protein